MKVHYRRCHRCLTVNCQNDSLVDRCQTCGKHLMSFLFFDEKLALGLDISSNELIDKKQSSILKANYPPVQGLTVYWFEE